MITGIHHAQITIPKGKEKEARAFYCGVMGLKEAPKPESLRGRDGFWLQVGDKQVHVGTEDGVGRTHSKTHIAYEVSDSAYWRNVMAAHGIETFSGESIPGYDRFEFRDLFGNRIEMVQKL